MTTANHFDDWDATEDHHCVHCLTELDAWATRCHRCNASFHGASRHDLVSGRPDFDSVLADG